MKKIINNNNNNNNNNNKSKRRDKGKLGHVVQTGSCVCRKRVLNPVILLPCCILRP